MASAARILSATVLALVLAGCARWHTVASAPQWRLHASDGSSVDPAPWRASLSVAFAAVEQALGPFRRPVSVHVLEGEDARGAPPGGRSQPVLDAPGLGPARVRAFHTRASSGPFGWPAGLSGARGGIWVREPAAGVLVHELVHARLAELAPDLPRWLEEGLATWLADGVRADERWVVDGLAAWPLAELRSARPSEDELERLLGLRRGTDLDARDELLVHFVGWAAVYDLARERPELGPAGWLGELRREPHAAVRARVARSLAPEAELGHLDERLASEDAAERRAAAIGSWKLATPQVLERVASALEREQEPEARATMAVNLLAMAGVLRSRTSWRRAARAALPVLAEVELPDAGETQALRELGRFTRRPWLRTRGEQLLAELERLWRE